MGKLKSQTEYGRVMLCGNKYNEMPRKTVGLKLRLPDFGYVLGISSSPQSSTYIRVNMQLICVVHLLIEVGFKL